MWVAASLLQHDAVGGVHVQTVYASLDRVPSLLDPATYLTHYTKAETAFSHIVPTRMLLMNPYSKMRDPFESKQPMLRAASGWGGDSDAQERLFWLLQAQVALGQSSFGWCSLALVTASRISAVEHPRIAADSASTSAARGRRPRATRRRQSQARSAASR